MMNKGEYPGGAGVCTVLIRCGAMCSDEEDSAESTTDEDNVEDNTCQDATDDRSVHMVFDHCLIC